MFECNAIDLALPCSYIFIYGFCSSRSIYSSAIGSCSADLKISSSTFSVILDLDKDLGVSIWNNPALLLAIGTGLGISRGTYASSSSTFETLN
jgi:hypothetical protein